MSLLYELCLEIKKNGGRAYAVGGYVRDRLLGIENKDVDIEVFHMEPLLLEKILANFGSWKKVGSYEIYLMKCAYEVSLPRNSKGELDINLSVKEAAGRRDLTINSIYYDPIEGRYLDYYKGIEHIKNKRLSYVNRKSFLADNIRILRVVSFLSRLESFSVSSTLKELIIENSFKLEFEKKERIFIELSKILLRGSDIKKAFEFIRKTEMNKYIFQEIQIENIDFERLIYSERDIKISLALFLMRLPLYRTFLKKNIDSKKLIGEVVNLIENYEEFCHIAENPKAVPVKKIALKGDVEGFLKLYKIDKGKEASEFKILYNSVKDSMTPWIKGRDLINLGYKEDKLLGEKLKELYKLQIEEKFENKEALLLYAEKNMQNGQM